LCLNSNLQLRFEMFTRFQILDIGF
jgi:hypothetical protein